VGNDIYFDVTWDYSPGYCLTVITPWQLTRSVGPLAPGTYYIYARLFEYSQIPGEYTLMTDFIVTDHRFLVNPILLTVPEGGVSWFTIVMTLDPNETIEVNATYESGDPDITVQSGGTLFFDPCNYSVPQTVTLAAAEDEDYLNGQAIIQVSTSECLTAKVTANEGDNDIPSVLYVDADANGNNDGSSWADAFTDLQEALGIAEQYPEVEEIWVAQGVYKPTGPNGDRDATYLLVGGVAIKGGYAGFGEPNPNTRDIREYETILSGDLNSDDGPDFANNGENSKRVVTGGNTDLAAVLDGFTVTGGNGVSGAGLYNLHQSNLTLSNCVFARNLAWYGAGICIQGGDNIVIRNCIISGNSAKRYNNNGRGGGICCLNAVTVIITNSTINSNSAEQGEYGNGRGGGGLCAWGGANIELTNSILWDNSDFGGTDESAQIYLFYGEGTSPAIATINYSCIQDWTGALGGTGNIGQDPLFADPNNGDYHLKSEGWRWDAQRKVWTWDEVTSRCIDAGNPGSPLADEPLTLDVDPLNRWGENIRINMGAYGGTAEASMPPYDWALLSDMTNDGTVNSSDLGVFVSYWLDSGECIPSDLNRNQFVNFLDYAVFAQQWSDTLASKAGIEYEITPCDMGSSAAGQSGETRFTVTVQGRYILFEDMMVANCCPDELELQMTVDGNLITIYEIEYLSYPCLCICDYPVTATLGPFEPGTYTLEVYQKEGYGGFIGSTTVTIE
jgi:hypothetical protein